MQNLPVVVKFLVNFCLRKVSKICRLGYFSALFVSTFIREMVKRKSDKDFSDSLQEEPSSNDGSLALVPFPYGPQQSTPPTTEKEEDFDDKNFEEYMDMDIPYIWFPYCITCRLQYIPAHDFYHHLASSSHLYTSLECEEPAMFGTMVLKLPEFLLWGQAVNERSIVLTDLPSGGSPNAILQHFCKFGYVTDYVADEDGSFAVVQYSDKLWAKRVLADKRCHQFRGFGVTVRRKVAVSMIEWTILLDLDGIYDKTDQRFFIGHCEMMYFLEKQAFALHTQLLYFLEETSLTKNGVKMQRKFYKHLSAIFQKVFPDMIFRIIQPPQGRILLEADPIFEMFLDPFGESMACPRQVSDRNSHHHCQKYQKAIKQVTFLVSKLPGYGYMSEQVEILVQDLLAQPEGRFRVGNPIDTVVFRDLESGMRCSIAFDDPFAPLVGSLVDFMLDIEPIIGPMIKFVKYWTRACRLNEALSTASSVVTMILLVFFMKKKMLPSVRALQKLHSYETPTDKKPRWMQGWKITWCTHIPTIEDYLNRKNYSPPRCECECKFTNKVPSRPSRPEEPSNSSKEDAEDLEKSIAIFTLLQEFFEWLVRINFEESVVSLYFGEVMERFDFLHGKNMPQYYVHKYPTHLTLRPQQVCPISSLEPPITVQHPFELSRNVTWNANPVFVNRMQLQAQKTCQRIAVELSSCKPQISKMFPDIHSLMNWELRPQPPESDDLVTVTVLDHQTHTSSSSNSGSSNSTSTPTPSPNSGTSNSTSTSTPSPKENGETDRESWTEEEETEVQSDEAW